MVHKTNSNESERIQVKSGYVLWPGAVKLEVEKNIPGNPPYLWKLTTYFFITQSQKSTCQLFWTECKWKPNSKICGTFHIFTVVTNHLKLSDVTICSFSLGGQKHKVSFTGQKSSSQQVSFLWKHYWESVPYLSIFTGFLSSSAGVLPPPSKPTGEHFQISLSLLPLPFTFDFIGFTELIHDNALPISWSLILLH